MTKEEKREYSRETRAQRKAQGICSNCGREKAEDGKSLCTACKLKNQEHSRNYYRNLPLEEKLKLLDSKMALRAERKAKGLCTRCGEPAFNGMVLCKEHYYKRNEYRQKEARKNA